MNTTRETADRIRWLTALNSMNWRVLAGRLTRKSKGWEHLFEVPDLPWEKQTEDLYSMHVTVPGSRHVVVYAYHETTEFYVVTYMENAYTDPTEDKQLWIGAMEALCIVLEALKERNSLIPPTSKRGT